MSVLLAYLAVHVSQKIAKSTSNFDKRITFDIYKYSVEFLVMFVFKNLRVRCGIQIMQIYVNICMQC